VPERDESSSAGEAFGRTSGASEAWDDRDLLEGVRRRESDALAKFFEMAFPYVYSLAWRLTGNREAAEDVAQEVFLKVHRAADRLDPDRNPRPWLTTITYNAVRDAARRSAARPEDATDASEIGERTAAAETPDQVLEDREQVKILERALAELDEGLRTIVLLRDFSGLSHEEIAGIVGASHDAVRKRYSRALARLREIIEEMEG